MTNRGKFAVMLGVIAMGLSPSFIDWQQSPDKHGQIMLYYGGVIMLIAFGLWDED